MRDSSSKIAALSILMVLLTACATKRAEPTGARAITDELGRAVHVAANPQRIVSLAPSVTETLFALGLQDRIVGVTSFCDYPPEAKSRESVGDTQRPGIEKIVALKPDLVIASTASQLEDFVRKLDEVGIPVYVSNPHDLAGVLTTIGRIGELAGAPDRAEDITNRMRERIERVHSRVAGRKPPRVFFILGTEPLFTVGGASFINELIARAGGASISADEKSEYPQYSMETAIARQPEVIFLQAGEEKLPERLKETPAARMGRVFRLDDALLIRPGPRIVEGLEQMTAKIHPETL